MKKSNMLLIIFYNIAWLLLSYSWCYRFIKKVRTPILYFGLFYVFIFLGLTISFIFLIKKFKNPFTLTIFSSLVSIVVGTLALTLMGLAIEAPDFKFFIKDFNEHGLFYIIYRSFCFSSVYTLLFIIGPASLLSSYYTSLLLQKLKKKR